MKPLANSVEPAARKMRLSCPWGIARWLFRPDFWRWAAKSLRMARIRRLDGPWPSLDEHYSEICHDSNDLRRSIVE